MRISTLPRYLIGSRQAIIEVATAPGALLIGVLFTISAGFAREYDGEDLLHESWHLLRPLAASLVSGTLLFLVVHGMTRGGDVGRRPRFLDAYRVFMSLFWMTAPLAWLYAVPYERFLSPVAAIQVNLWTLLIVAAWRVKLMIRVISVMYGVPALAVFFVVMMFADALAFTAVSLVPTPLINIMGGIHHTDRDALVASITGSIVTLSVITAPIWFLGMLITAGCMRPTWPIDFAVRPASAPGRLRLAAMVSIVAWAPLLLVSQPEQVRRRAAENLLYGGKVAEGLAAMSSYDADAYPPHWNPPPRLGYGESTPDLDRVRDAMADDWPADWVADVYLEKMHRELRRAVGGWMWSPPWPDIAARVTGDESIREAARRAADGVAFLLECDAALSHADRTALEAIVREAADDPADAG